MTRHNFLDTTVLMGQDNQIDRICSFDIELVEVTSDNEDCCIQEFKGDPTFIERIVADFDSKFQYELTNVNLTTGELSIDLEAKVIEYDSGQYSDDVTVVDHEFTIGCNENTATSIEFELEMELCESASEGLTCQFWLESKPDLIISTFTLKFRATTSVGTADISESINLM